jgi:hypothetical protein
MDGFTCDRKLSGVFVAFFRAPLQRTMHRATLDFLPFWINPFYEPSELAL